MIRLPTQRTRTRITTPKPLEQTRIMKHILARRTTFRRQFFGFVDNRVTNRTFHVALERSGDVFAKGCERVGDVAVLEIYINKMFFLVGWGGGRGGLR